MKSAITILCIGLFTAWPVHAGVPAFVTYSGRLTDGTGWVESTEATLVFRLYVSATETTTPFWTGTHPDVPVVDGYFTVNLGMCNTDGSACTVNPAEATFPGDIPDQMWVGVEVGGVELERQPVGSVPYAGRAEHAATVGNPLCASAPCIDSDLKITSTAVSVPASSFDAEITVFCPSTHPIPVTGGCNSSSLAMYVSRTFPLNWTTPSTWKSNTLSQHAGWSCGYKNTNSQAMNANSYIVCRKEN